VRYHERHREQLPELVRLSRRVETVHADRPECPHGLADHLEDMLQELESHMQKEEQILFPLIAQGMSPTGLPPVEVMRFEHDQHGQSLAQMVSLAHGLAMPRGACNTWRALLAGLQTLREDLMQHIHLENNVLFEGLNAPEAATRYRGRLRRGLRLRRRGRLTLLPVLRGALAMVCSEPDCQLIARALAPSVIPSEACDRLLQAACVIDVPIGLIQHATPAKPLPSLWLLRRGQLAAGGLDRRGRFTELFRVQAGEWVDVFGALGQPGWFRSLMATEPSELLALPIDAVLRIAQQHPRWAWPSARCWPPGPGPARRADRCPHPRPGCPPGRRILDETAGRDGASSQPVWQMAVRKQQLAQQLG
jgi:hemerythrin-like domain-containing protein